MNIGREVDRIMMECLMGEQGDLKVDAVIHTYGFSKKNIEKNREDIRELLNLMPIEFHIRGGGGASFLNLCRDAEGAQWTSAQIQMEALLALGIAVDMAEYLLPKSVWRGLPGGMPYVVFNTKESR